MTSKPPFDMTLRNMNVGKLFIILLPIVLGSAAQATPFKPLCQLLLSNDPITEELETLESLQNAKQAQAFHEKYKNEDEMEFYQGEFVSIKDEIFLRQRLTDLQEYRDYVSFYESLYFAKFFQLKNEIGMPQTPGEKSKLLEAEKAYLYMVQFRTDIDQRIEMIDVEIGDEFTQAISEKIKMQVPGSEQRRLLEARLQNQKDDDLKDKD